MKILVMSGSPHVNGTTALLRDAFIEGTLNAGHTVNVSLVQLATSAVVLIPYVLIVEDTSTVQFNTLNISMLLIIGIVHTGIAYALYYSCLKDLKSQTVALYSYIDPVVSVLLAILILNESMSFMKLIGAVLILGAAIIGEIKPKNV